MPAKKKFSCETCGECLVWFVCETDPAEINGECRLYPPVPISPYAAEYPKVRVDNPACFAGTQQPAPAKKKVSKKCKTS